MKNKLAFRNVKRSARDYLIYFLTMTVVAALMFSFNTLIFSEDVQNMFETAGMMAVMIGAATVFIVLIVAWLTSYMVRFILEKRSREFGIYLLIGMKKKEIAGLYIQENLFLGTGAFVLGMALGLLLQQILLAVFYGMVQMNYHLHLELNRSCILMTASCYGGCYFLALFGCRRKFKKMSIRDLMDSQKKNEEVRGKHEKAKRLLLPFSLLFFAIFGVFLFCWKNWNVGIVLLFLTGLVLTIYLFYTGIAAWISYYVRKKGKAVYRGDALFLLRQFSSKVRTMSFTMGTLSALFTLALLGSTVALMFNHFQDEILVNKFPFDVQVYSSNAEDDFRQEISLLKKKTQVKETFIYQIYENGTNQVNAWLYTHLRVFGSDYLKKDGTPNWKKISRNAEMVYCNYDTYMKLSDYNHLRRMLGLPEIVLGEGEYAIHIKERVLKETGDFSAELNIEGKDGPLAFAGYHTESFSQDGHNGGDYVIVVPDSVIDGEASEMTAGRTAENEQSRPDSVIDGEVSKTTVGRTDENEQSRPGFVIDGEESEKADGRTAENVQSRLNSVTDGTSGAKEMRPYYSELAADLEGAAPAGLQDKLDNLETDPKKRNTQGHVKTEAADDYDWEEENRGNSCCGSDTIVVFVAKNLVRDNLIPELKGILLSLIFPLFYVGLVFFCVALTVLSVQQLGDSSKYRFRYRVLSQMGCSRKEISRIILKQLLGYYMCPALEALAVSGVISIYAGGRFNFYTGTHTPAAGYFLISASLFFGIYVAYFSVTCVGFRRNIERKD